MGIINVMLLDNKSQIPVDKASPLLNSNIEPAVSRILNHIQTTNCYIASAVCLERVITICGQRDSP